ncbi:ANTH-domain-containing protein [Rhizophagus irregularis]|uniref:ANTH-domain-containing protein n=3 Tax=Rhizophagus irregularis TaxID=588596 RepID=A0A2I1EKI7_9GLOM|nr:cytoskeleton assembly control protein [Rhizophagus irregularis DAOM 181602=DAOM 197198]PKC07870.1 ANTH-domain-containing protein [Rhizophagus irregularis]PKC63428.1 ANTH-domain-containing protein [Rhizophagus irregularis]PKK69998.1 ANTH-domain-containing protein [Rhizophagus irregularis]PKY22648.1 ANTH-domain-containing protein [Rhizophagus irregularis]POG75723.1 cytoskeleton assembly control protein [Rhizophagus irregularis DAOM 181602=DAOM 197198]|eukprot:XP_025182589.1 cytoskeleton assembly control protein [Rhizophagus irregularis DAOM 181602=DAOM 197198]
MEAHYPTRPVDREKAEHDLALNIKKATSPDETAPKQKHVRKCIVYTWDYRTSDSIWNGLKVAPILADEIQTFKALITVHKVIRGGHPVTLKEAQNQINWLDSCARSVTGDGSRGYGTLIRVYVDFLKAKLAYHRHHPEFNGNFDYEEYISLKNVDDPNEGYETISELMNLQDQIDQFQKLIFVHFRPSSSNECRIAALVPLVEESYGIYKFLTSMLRAMHKRTDAIDALTLLRTRYNAQHYGLIKFYYECSNLKYLTSLINVPKLPQDPPSLIDGSAPNLPKPKSPAPSSHSEPEPITEFWKENEAQKQQELERQRLQYEEQQRQLAQQRELELQAQRRMEAQRQRELEEQQRMQQERERLAREQLIREQMQRQAEGRVAELERELLNMRNNVERGQLMLEQYDRRVKALENEMSQLNLNAQQQIKSKDEMMKNLQDQLLMWRNKYEALAKLYSQLRQEHLELINKFKAAQLKANSAQEAIDKMERMERDMRAKNLELADMIRERDRSRHELDRLKSKLSASGLKIPKPNDEIEVKLEYRYFIEKHVLRLITMTIPISELSQREDLERAKRDLNEANARIEELSRSRTNEISSLTSKFNKEKQELEDSLRSKQSFVDTLLKQLEEKKNEIERVTQDKDVEIAIMQSAMDQSMNLVAEMQQSTTESEKYQSRIDNLVLDHLKDLNEILDSIFQTCIQKIDDSLYELESPMQTGNQNSTPEYTLSMIEKATTECSEFSYALQKFLKNNRTKDHTEVIKSATNFSQAIADVLINSKGITRLADEDDEISEEIVGAAKMAAHNSQKFFLNVQSFKLDDLPASKRSSVVLQSDMDVQAALQKISKVIEGLLRHTLDVTKKADGEIGNLVEQEMLNAAQVIKAAAEKIQALMSQPRDAGLTASELNIHDAILESALAVTNAIANLIKCATDSQEEIVAQGRGSSSHAAFYKKNNRWTEGLISAAKAIAVATNLLIETADGVIHKTHNLEQLIVASNEVAAATAQLVAASRVKADFMSKTQDRLETASRAVTEACKALVKAVKTIAAKQLEQQEASVDYSKLTRYEFKVTEMEQQVEILKLEKELTNARKKLAELRKFSYHDEEEE